MEKISFTLLAFLSACGTRHLSRNWSHLARGRSFRLIRLRLASSRQLIRPVKSFRRGWVQNGVKTGLSIDFWRNRREIRLQLKIRREGEYVFVKLIVERHSTCLMVTFLAGKAVALIKTELTRLQGE